MHPRNPARLCAISNHAVDHSILWYSCCCKAEGRQNMTYSTGMEISISQPYKKYARAYISLVYLPFGFKYFAITSISRRSINWDTSFISFVIGLLQYTKGTRHGKSMRLISLPQLSLSLAPDLPFCRSFRACQSIRCWVMICYLASLTLNWAGALELLGFQTSAAAPC